MMSIFCQHPHTMSCVGVKYI